MSKDKKMAAYIEHTVDKDGSALGVVVTRDSMFMHTVALTQACGYTEGEFFFSATLANLFTYSLLNELLYYFSCSRL